MRCVISDRDTIIKDITELCKMYGYYDSIVEHNPDSTEAELTILFLSYPNSYLDVEGLSMVDNLEVVELISLLGKSGEIKVKGSTSSITLKNELLKKILFRFLNYMLDKSSGYDYYNEFGWDLDEWYTNAFGCNDWEKHTPYSVQQLNMILDIERKNAMVKKKLFDGKSPAKRLGNLAGWTYSQMKNMGIFGHEGHKTRKELCFIYDYLSLLEKVERKDYGVHEGIIAGEKARSVANWINATGIDV